MTTKTGYTRKKFKDVVKKRQTMKTVLPLKVEKKKFGLFFNEELGLNNIIGTTKINYG